MSTIKSDRTVIYAGEQMRVDALAKSIDTMPRTVDGELYHISTKILSISRLGIVKLLVTEKKSAESNGDEVSVRYLVSNKIVPPLDTSLTMVIDKTLITPLK